MVMLILAIVVGSIAPALRGFAIGRRSANTAQAIVNLAKFARAEAIAEGCVYRLNLDDHSAWLTRDDGSTWQPPANDFATPIEWTDELSVQSDLPPGDERFIAFQPSGRSDPVRLTLTDRFGVVVHVGAAAPTAAFGILNPEVTP